MIYLHLSTRKLKAAPNPLETLAGQPGWEPVASRAGRPWRYSGFLGHRPRQIATDDEFIKQAVGFIKVEQRESGLRIQFGR